MSKPKREPILPYIWCILFHRRYWCKNQMGIWCVRCLSFFPF